jgi:hypothetical protein
MQNGLSRSSLPISEQETQCAKKGVYVYVKSMSLICCLKIYSVIYVIYRFWHNRDRKERISKYWKLYVLIQLQWFSRQSWRLTQKLLNKDILHLGWSHHCKNSTIVITTWLTAITYSYLKWQLIFYFSSRFVSLLYHCQDFYMTWLYIWATRWMSYKNCLPFVSTPGFLSDSCCSSFLVFLCYPVLSSVLWCALRCSHINDAPFVFTSCCMYDEWRLILCICVCMRIMAYNTHSMYICNIVDVILKHMGSTRGLCWGPFCSSFWCSGFFGFVFLLFCGVFCLYSSGLLYTHCLQCLWINQSSLPLRISLMFI